MKEVTVDTKALRKILVTNKEKHKADFEKAWSAFVRTVIAKLKETLKQIEKGRIKDFKKTLNSLAYMPVPQNHTESYDRAIAMLDMHQEPVVILTDGDYQQYIEDNWRWKQEFQTTSASYGVGTYDDVEYGDSF